MRINSQNGIVRYYGNGMATVVQKIICRDFLNSEIIEWQRHLIKFRLKLCKMVTC